MSIRAYIASSAISGMVNTIGSALTILALLPLIIRNVGMETYGVWAISGLFVSLAAALDLGVSKAMVLITATGARKERQHMLVAGLGLVTITAIATFCVIYVASKSGAHFATPTAIPSELTDFILISGFLVVLAGVWLSVFRGILEAHLRLGFVNGGFLAITVVQYVGVWLVSLVRDDARTLIGFTVFTYLVVLAAHAIAAFRIVGLPSGLPPLRSAKGIVSISLPLFAIAAPTVVMYPLLGTVVLRAATTSGEYGQFDIALRLSTMAATALGSIGAPVLGLVAGGHVMAGSRLERIVNRTTVISLILCLLGVTTFALVGPRIVSLILGYDDAAVFQASLVMMGGAAWFAAVEPITRALYATRDFAPVLIARIGILLVSVGGTVLMVHSPLRSASLSYGLAFAFAAAGMGIYWQVRGAAGNGPARRS